MKHLAYFTFITLFFFVQQSHAHSSHSAITSDQALDIGTSLVQEFVKYDYELGIGTLSESWKSVSQQNIKIHKKGEDYFIISASNETKGKTLYIQLSNTGDVIGANFTGSFKDTK